MAGLNFNITNRLPAKKGIDIIEIFSMDDFPDPVGEVITLPPGKYIIKDDITTTDRFLINTLGAVSFVVENNRNNFLIYTGDATLFTATIASVFELNKLNILCTGTNAQCFDVSTGDMICNDVSIIMQGTNSKIGVLQDIRIIQLRDTLFAGFKNGIDIRNIEGLTGEKLLIQSNQTGSGVFFNFEKSVSSFIALANAEISLAPSEKVFYINPEIKADISIEKFTSADSADFFKVGVTGLITGFVDNSIGITAVTATDSGGDAQFNSVGHGLVVGEIVTHTTFSESEYNGDFVVTAITTDTYFIGIDYESNDAGLFETTTTQVNSTAHGLSNDTGVSVFGTINFGEGYSIFNVQTNSFEISINKVFPGNETTGNWDTGSLTQKSKYVTTHNNGDQKDSKNIGSFLVGGNITATDINTKDVFEDLNLNSSIEEASDNELWTLLDKTTGEIRYDGLTPVSISYAGLVAASSAGGAQLFSLRLLRNGSPLSSPDDVNIPLEIAATIKSTALIWSVTADPQDVFKLQVANTDGVSDITIDTLKVRIV